MYIVVINGFINASSTFDRNIRKIDIHINITGGVCIMTCDYVVHINIHVQM